MFSAGEVVNPTGSPQAQTSLNADSITLHTTGTTDAVNTAISALTLPYRALLDSIRVFDSLLRQANLNPDSVSIPDFCRLTNPHDVFSNERGLFLPHSVLDLPEIADSTGLPGKILKQAAITARLIQRSAFHFYRSSPDAKDFSFSLGQAETLLVNLRKLAGTAMFAAETSTLETVMKDISLSQFDLNSQAVYEIRDFVAKVLRESGFERHSNLWGERTVGRSFEVLIYPREGFWRLGIVDNFRMETCPNQRVTVNIGSFAYPEYIQTLFSLIPETNRSMPIWPTGVNQWIKQNIVELQNLRLPAPLDEYTRECRAMGLGTLPYRFAFQPSSLPSTPDFNIITASNPLFETLGNLVTGLRQRFSSFSLSDSWNRLSGSFRMTESQMQAIRSNPVPATLGGIALNSGIMLFLLATGEGVNYLYERYLNEERPSGSYTHTGIVLGIMTIGGFILGALSHTGTGMAVRTALGRSASGTLTGLPASLPNSLLISMGLQISEEIYDLNSNNTTMRWINNALLSIGGAVSCYITVDGISMAAVLAEESIPWLTRIWTAGRIGGIAGLIIAGGAILSAIQSVCQDYVSNRIGNAAVNASLNFVDEEAEANIRENFSRELNDDLSISSCVACGANMLLGASVQQESLNIVNALSWLHGYLSGQREGNDHPREVAEMDSLA